jgi:hypothetical protein
MASPPPLPPDGGRGDRRRRDKPNPLHILEGVIRDYPDTAPDLDLVRSALLKVQRRAQERTRLLAAQGRHFKRGRDSARARLDALLHAAAGGVVVLPKSSAAPTADELRHAFHELKSREFPALAHAVKARTRRSSVGDLERLLGREVLIVAACLAAERAVVRGPDWAAGGDGAEARLPLRQAVARTAGRRLRRKAGLKTLGPIEGQLNLLVERSLRFAIDLLAAGGRLLAPAPGARFDPLRHEAMPGRPSEGDLVVRALLFPGFAVGAEPAAEKAVVYTDPKAPPPEQKRQGGGGAPPPP